MEIRGRIIWSLGTAFPVPLGALYRSPCRRRVYLATRPRTSLNLTALQSVIHRIHAIPRASVRKIPAGLCVACTNRWWLAARYICMILYSSKIWLRLPRVYRRGGAVDRGQIKSQEKEGQENNYKASFLRPSPQI